MAQPPGLYGQAPYAQGPQGQSPYGQGPYSQPYGQYGTGAPTAPAPVDDRPAQVVPWTGPPLPPPYATAPVPYATGPGPGPVPYRPLPPQRPALVGMAATLAVTASVQLIGVVSFVWLIAVTAADTLGLEGADGAIFHMLNRFSYRMVDGLAFPLYLFPVAASVAGFLLLMRKAWARIALSAVGVASLAWSAWWLQGSLEWWVIPAAYVVFTCAITWVPSVSRWYAEGRAPRA